MDLLRLKRKIGIGKKSQAKNLFLTDVIEQTSTVQKCNMKDLKEQRYQSHDV